MIIGILSDTHGRASIAHEAVRILLANNAEYLVHCGDVGDDASGIDVLDALAGNPAMFVFGNNDFDRAGLEKYSKLVGVACGRTCGKLSFGGKLAVVTHGDDGSLMRKLLHDQQIDYLFHGHTHQKLDTRQGRVRVINPGALYRAPTKTVAVLDTVTDHLRFLPVSETKKL